MASYLHAKKRCKSSHETMAARKKAQEAFATALAGCNQTADYTALHSRINKEAATKQPEKTSGDS